MEKCKTLGEKSYFLYNYVDNRLTLIYGFMKKNQNFVILNDEFICKIILRVKKIQEDNPLLIKSAKQYESPIWDKCPNTIYSPYVAKLVLDVFPKETLNNILEKFL